MLKDLYWLSYSENVDIEIMQSDEEGRCVEGCKAKADQIKTADIDRQSREDLALQLCDELAFAQKRDDYPFEEPSDLASIRAARLQVPARTYRNLPARSQEEIFDKIHGAWLGRCCGCLLGQPIENWLRSRIVGLLKDTANYPVNYYISSDISHELRKKYDVVDEKKIYGSNTASWINNISCMPEDDDINYTLIALKAMELYGYSFTPENMAEIWLESLPFSHVCTAERIAYRNFTNLIAPPRSAEYRNPFREWIGAQIRADLFGYVTPGNPQQGAELAWRDASISHTKNGIYGAMFVAAMLSEAAVSNDIDAIIRAGLAEIPQKSRLYKQLKEIIDIESRPADWEQAFDALHEQFDEENIHDWCHTIPNAAIVTIALLFGDLSLEKSLGIAVSAGFDTDCNGATVGSVIGMIVGADKLPDKWKSPMNDKLKSGVDGLGLVSISDMAKRTCSLLNAQVV